MPRPPRKPPPELTPEELRALGARIREAVGRMPTQQAAADAAGISAQALYKLMGGKSAPSLLPLSRLATAAGVRLEWIATGVEPMLAADAPGILDLVSGAAKAAALVRPALDTASKAGARVKLMRDLGERIRVTYEEEDAVLPDVEADRLAEAAYDMIMATGLVPAAWPHLIEAIVAHHREELRSESPAKRKRGA